MSKICVFCGSKSGADSIFSETSYQLGVWLAKNNHQLVYGAGKVGLMGEVARGVNDYNGIIHGVIPKKLIEMEVANKNVTHFYQVDTMHQRKQKMYDLSDLFVALPGGLGTLDEFFEIVTWSQIGYHKKHCLLININGFFDHIINHIDHLVKTEFLSKEDRKLIKIINKFEDLDRFL